MDPVAELITSYFELNGSTIDELDDGGTEPSPLEFMRYVARNTPFVVRRGAATWPAVQNWSVPFLHRTLAENTVNVAVTPNGLVLHALLFRLVLLTSVLTYTVDTPMHRHPGRTAMSCSPSRGRRTRHSQTFSTMS